MIFYLYEIEIRFSHVLKYRGGDFLKRIIVLALVFVALMFTTTIATATIDIPTINTLNQTLSIENDVVPSGDPIDGGPPGTPSGDPI